MELKTIVAIVLVAFIIGGFIFLQIRSKNKK
jgi:preprotein translocase subunit YajC